MCTSLDQKGQGDIPFRMIAGTSNSILPELLGKLCRKVFPEPAASTALALCPHCGRRDEPEVASQPQLYSPRRPARMQPATAANRANRDHLISVVAIEDVERDLRSGFSDEYQDAQPRNIRRNQRA